MNIIITNFNVQYNHFQYIFVAFLTIKQTSVVSQNMYSIGLKPIGNNDVIQLFFVITLTLGPVILFSSRVSLFSGRLSRVINRYRGAAGSFTKFALYQ